MIIINLLVRHNNGQKLILSDRDCFALAAIILKASTFSKILPQGGNNKKARPVFELRQHIVACGVIDPIGKCLDK